MKNNWRNWKKGRKTIYAGSDFSGSFYAEGIITETYNDHAICEADGQTLWIDDDTAYLFR